MAKRRMLLLQVILTTEATKGLHQYSSKFVRVVFVKQIAKEFTTQYLHFRLYNIIYGLQGVTSLNPHFSFLNEIIKSL